MTAENKALVEALMKSTGVTEAEAREGVIAQMLADDSMTDTIYDSEELPPTVSKEI